MTVELELPYPPSVNHYWRRVGARTLISRGGRAFRRRVCAILAAGDVRPLQGELDVEVVVFPPDEKRRDVDNDFCFFGSSHAGHKFVCDTNASHGAFWKG